MCTINRKDMKATSNSCSWLSTGSCCVPCCPGACSVFLNVWSCSTLCRACRSSRCSWPVWPSCSRWPGSFPTPATPTRPACASTIVWWVRVFGIVKLCVQEMPTAVFCSLMSGICAVIEIHYSFDYSYVYWSEKWTFAAVSALVFRLILKVKLRLIIKEKFDLKNKKIQKNSKICFGVDRISENILQSFQADAVAMVFLHAAVAFALTWFWPNTNYSIRLHLLVADPDKSRKSFVCDLLSKTSIVSFCLIQIRNLDLLVSSA